MKKIILILIILISGLTIKAQNNSQSFTTSLEIKEKTFTISNKLMGVNSTNTIIKLREELINRLNHGIYVRNLLLKTYLTGFISISLLIIIANAIRKEEDLYRDLDCLDLALIITTLLFWPVALIYFVFYIMFKVLTSLFRYIYRKLKITFPSIRNIFKWIDKITNFFY